MTWKSLLAIVVGLLFSQTTFGEQTFTGSTVHVGDSVVLELTGAPAISLLRLQGSEHFESVKDGNVNFCMPLEGRVVGVDKAGEVSVQCCQVPSIPSKELRTVTIDVRFANNRILSPPRFSDPLPSQPLGERDRFVLETKVRQANLPRVKIENMKGVRLRAWKAIEEVVE